MFQLSCERCFYIIDPECPSVKAVKGSEIEKQLRKVLEETWTTEDVEYMVSECMERIFKDKVVVPEKDILCAVREAMKDPEQRAWVQANLQKTLKKLHIE